MVRNQAEKNDKPAFSCSMSISSVWFILLTWMFELTADEIATTQSAIFTCTWTSWKNNISDSEIILQALLNLSSSLFYEKTFYKYIEAEICGS